MQCEQAEMLLAQLAFGELEAEGDETRRLSAHLDECPACREKLGDLRVTTSLLREAIEAGPTPKLSTERQAALMRLTAESKPATSPQPKRVARRGYDVLCAVFRHRGVGIAASLGLLAVVGSVLSPSLHRAKEMSYRASVGEEFARDEPLHERGYFDDSTALYGWRLGEQVDAKSANRATWQDGDFDRYAEGKQRDERRWSVQAGEALTTDHYALKVESAPARKSVRDLAAGKSYGVEMSASGRARGIDLYEAESARRGGQVASGETAGATTTLPTPTPLAAVIPSTGERVESLSRSTRNYAFSDLSDQTEGRRLARGRVTAGDTLDDKAATGLIASEAKVGKLETEVHRSSLATELSEGLVQEYVDGRGDATRRGGAVGAVGAGRYGLDRFDAPSAQAPGQMAQGQTDGEANDWAYSPPSPATKPAGGATLESLVQQAPGATAPSPPTTGFIVPRADPTPATPAEQPANQLGAFYKDFGRPMREADESEALATDKFAPAPTGPSAALTIRGTRAAEPQLQPPVDSLAMGIEKLDIAKSKQSPLDPFGGRMAEELNRERRGEAIDAADHHRRDEPLDEQLRKQQELAETARAESEREKGIASQLHDLPTLGLAAEKQQEKASGLQRLHAGVEPQPGEPSTDAGVVAEDVTVRMLRLQPVDGRLSYSERAGETGTTTYDTDLMVRKGDSVDQNGQLAGSGTRQGLTTGAAIVNNRLIVAGSAQRQEQLRQLFMARVEQQVRLGDGAGRVETATPEPTPDLTAEQAPEQNPDQTGPARPGSLDDGSALAGEPPLPDAIETITDPQPAEVNPFVMADQDAYSTFSIDVDTASYSQSRNYIRRGYLPPVQSVRVEEFVNAFEYNYPTQERQTFRVHSEASASPFGQGLTLLKVGVKGKALGRESRKPAHLVLVVDASGSMDKPDRLPLVREALTALTGQLGERDTVSLVTYGTRAQLVLESAAATDHAAIIGALRSIQTGGSTNMIEGLHLGYEQARRAYRPHQVNRVILCSDGVANVGAVDAQAMLDKVAAHREQGIGLTCAGFGSGSYNDALLEQLANRGDGAYVFVDSQAEANRVFVEQLAATIQNIARDVKIQVAFDPSRVRRYRLLGYENRDIADKDFRNDAVDAGEVGSGQAATALYELELAEGPNLVRFDGARRQPAGELGTVYVRYRDVERNEVQEIAHRLGADVVRSCTPQSDPRFHLAASAAQFAELLRLSRYAQEDGGFEQLEQVVAQVAEQLPLDGQVAELLELVRQCRRGLPRAK